MATRVLLVEDDPADAYIFRRYLKADGRHSFDLEHVGQLGLGLERLSSDKFQALVLDLGLPDSLGYDTFCRTYREAHDLPIIVLSSNDDEELALRAVREGAQDYLVKSEITGPLLVRAICYAIERHHLQRSLRALSLTDELTGLYNRRGFQTLAEQQLKQARRAGIVLSLVFADLDGLKQINDTFGHHAGDGALAEAAGILRRCFRDTDIVARIGGDEFAVLLVDAREDSIPVPLARLREHIDRAGEEPGRAFPMSMSLGLASRNPDSPCSLDDLIDEADRNMYRDKRRKKSVPE